MVYGDAFHVLPYILHVLGKSFSNFRFSNFLFLPFWMMKPICNGVYALKDNSSLTVFIRPFFPSLA